MYKKEQKMKILKRQVQQERALKDPHSQPNYQPQPTRKMKTASILKFQQSMTDWEEKKNKNIQME